MGVLYANVDGVWEEIGSVGGGSPGPTGPTGPTGPAPTGTAISALAALAGLADGDLIELVDVSDTTMAATGTNKKTPLSELVGYLAATSLGRGVIKADTTTAYTPILTDENKMITLSNAAAISVTLPSNATTAFPIGAEVDFLWYGVGQPTFVAGSGATVNGTPGLKLRARYSAATAKKMATNEWVVIGDLSA